MVVEVDGHLVAGSPDRHPVENALGAWSPCQTCVSSWTGFPISDYTAIRRSTGISRKPENISVRRVFGRVCFSLPTTFGVVFKTQSRLSAKPHNLFGEPLAENF